MPFDLKSTLQIIVSLNDLHYGDISVLKSPCKGCWKLVARVCRTKAVSASAQGGKALAQMLNPILGTLASDCPQEPCIDSPQCMFQHLPLPKFVCKVWLRYAWNLYGACHDRIWTCQGHTATHLVHWLILMVPSYLWSQNSGHIALQSLNILHAISSNPVSALEIEAKMTW